MSFEIEKRTGWKGPIEVTPETAIATGRYLHKLEYRQSEKGTEMFQIEVIDKDGRTARKTYFAPKMGGFVTTKEILAKEEAKFSWLMQNLTRSILGEEYETGKVSSFKEFCMKVMADIPESLYKKELRVKVILDDQNRSTLPKYSPIFEDPTKISLERSKLKIFPKERVTKVDIPMDKDVEDDGLPSKLKSSIEEVDDLPFA